MHSSKIAETEKVIFLANPVVLETIATINCKKIFGESTQSVEVDRGSLRLKTGLGQNLTTLNNSR